MRKRLVGLVVSIGLALFGTVVLVGYVQSAHDKAAAGEATTAVVVVAKPVPKGTPVGELEGLVETRELPVSAKAEGAVATLDAVDGLVAAVDLLPGEQVLAHRFMTAEKLGRGGVPDGLLEVTVSLDAERAVGGDLKPGDTVAVVASFEPFDLEDAGMPPAAPDAPGKTPFSTHLMLHKVLVSNVQTTRATAEPKEEKKKADGEEEEVKPKPAPEGKLLVTLALDASAVERVVFAAEYGRLWLSAEPADAPDGGTQVETRGIVLR